MAIPNLFKVYFGTAVIPFCKNPVYVSVRQIAWEAMERLKGRILDRTNIIESVHELRVQNDL